MATGKALLVGVREPGPESSWRADRLWGVDHDLANMERVLGDRGFQVEPPLRHEGATHEAVIGRIREAAGSLVRGDFFVFFYSGHGGRRVDVSEDEEDRHDELLLIWDEAIVDDELADLWTAFAAGVRIVTIMDACHSGTMARKATSRSRRPRIRKTPARPYMLGLPPRDEAEGVRSFGSHRTDIQASLIHISACRDSEQAADTRRGGAFTLALLEAMRQMPRDYDDLLAKIHRQFRWGEQVSELHTYGPQVDEVFRKERPFAVQLVDPSILDEMDATSDALAALLRSGRGQHRAAATASQGILLSRPPKHRLDLVLDGNSITEVTAEACVLGMFQGVTPAGPALAVDKLLGGVVRDLVSRRMFAARVGEVFMLPITSSPLPFDMLLFVGLGPLDQFHTRPAEIQRFVAENVIRTLVQIGVDEFASVLIGGGSGRSVQETLASLVAGFVDGLRDVDLGDRTRRVILCENDLQRYAQMVDTVHSYARSPSLDDIQLTVFHSPPRPAARRRPPPATAVADYRSRIFLHVNDRESGEGPSFESILLTAGGKATAISSSVPYAAEDRDDLMRPVGKSRFKVDEFGAELAEFALSEEFIEVLSGAITEDAHLVIVHDAESSRLPWETLRCGDRRPALEGGISRKYVVAGDSSIAKWLEKRRFDKELNILLVVDPTQDLKGAEREGRIIRDLTRDVKVAEISGKEATRSRLLSEFQSGTYDIIHYAGHAGFDEDAPERSGILCSDHQVLSGRDLATMGNLPALVFFNACESARVRRRRAEPMRELQKSVSFAEAFLRGGIANFIGTYWPVQDDSAEAFAKAFYVDIVGGRTIGDALLAGRRAVEALGNYDWADYIHYGDPDFRVKEAVAAG